MVKVIYNSGYSVEEFQSKEEAEEFILYIDRDLIQGIVEIDDSGNETQLGCGWSVKLMEI